MAGLLDGFGEFAKTPEGQGLLSAVFGGLAGARRGAPLNSLGNAGLAGLQGYSGALDRDQKTAQIAQQGKTREMAQQMQQMQMDEITRRNGQEAKQQAWRSGLPAVMDAKVYGAGEEGPTMAPDKAGIDRYLLSPDSPYADKMIKQKLFPSKGEGFTLGEGQVRYGADNQVLAQGPAKAASLPSAVQEYNFAKDQGYPGTFQQWSLEGKRAGASSVSVPINLGQKGLDNTLKVRSDFRSEPIYKAHQEVQSAYSQIQQALKQQSPVGDLAGATKIMKLLDPGSVVRESELGMAMAATGAMDRITNYSDMIIKGTKLTPSQRVDFQKLADSLYGESVKQYGAKRSEYQGIAERNQLSVDDVLGPEQKALQAKPMEAMPPAVQHKGKTIRDTATGKTLRSDGLTWKEGP